MGDIITIDGPASSGKTSTGYLFSRRINYQFIDSGSVYRAGTLAILRKSVDYMNEVENAKIFQSLDLKFAITPQGQKMLLDGEDVTAFLDAVEVTKVVPHIAAMHSVREAVRSIQRRLGLSAPTVITGRDVGTVVFPDARLKIFITASPEARAQRRFLQLQKDGEFITYESVLEDIKKRDEMDASRSESPFKKPDGAIVLDTSSIDIQQTIDALVKIYEENTIITADTK